jgi:hypothetical protein
MIEELTRMVEASERKAEREANEERSRKNLESGTERAPDPVHKNDPSA